MTNVYIAGPMTGLPSFGYPAFHEAGKLLAEHGFRVYSGAHRAHPWEDRAIAIDPPQPGEEKPHSYYMREAIKLLVKCDLIYLLDGWENSAGARLELQVAKAIGLKVLQLNDINDAGETPTPNRIPMHIAGRDFA